jgi:hypothetical protein
MFISKGVIVMLKDDKTWAIQDLDIDDLIDLIEQCEVKTR